MSSSPLSCSSRVAARWKRLTSASIRKYRGRARDDHVGNRPPIPRAPAYSSPLLSSRTDMRHVGVLGRDAEFVEQPAQRGIGAVVVHEEGRVHTDDLAVAAVDVVGVGVPAEPGVGLEERDTVTSGQHVARPSDRRRHCR